MLAGVNENLKLLLKQPHKNRSVFSFRSPLEFKQIVNEVTSISYPYEHEFKEWLGKKIFIGIACMLLKTFYHQSISIRLIISICLLFLEATTRGVQ